MPNDAGAYPFSPRTRTAWSVPYGSLPNGLGASRLRHLPATRSPRDAPPFARPPRDAVHERRHRRCLDRGRCARRRRQARGRAPGRGRQAVPWREAHDGGFRVRGAFAVRTLFYSFDLHLHLSAYPLFFTKIRYSSTRSSRNRCGRNPLLEFVLYLVFAL